MNDIGTFDILGPFALAWQVVADGLPGNGSEAGFGLTVSGLK